MKAISDYINESLLDDLEDLEKDSDKSIITSKIKKFLDNNYLFRGRYDIVPTETGPFIVNVESNVRVSNKLIKSLTNGMFKFGEVDGIFSITLCRKIKSLEGAPEKVTKSFRCSMCDSLASLEGAPKEVGNDFDCSMCDSLTSLKGAPKKVGLSFNCSGCKSLTSLEGAPEKVGKNFECAECKKLSSIKGIPKTIGGNFSVYGCPIVDNITPDDIKKVSKIKGKIKTKGTFLE